MLGVIIGRFQPFHNSHRDLVERALSKSDRVLIIIGSAFRSRAPRNPFTYEERRSIIESMYPDVVIEPCEDFIEDRTWKGSIVDVISNFTDESSKVRIFGNPVDIEINRKFLGDKFYEYEGYISKLDIRASQVRSMLYKGYSLNACKHMVPPETLAFLEKFDKKILKDLAHVSTKNRFHQGIYVTVDNMVFWRRFVALVTRKDNGLYALPGGYLEEDEEVIKGAARELKEETGLERKDLILRKQFFVDNIHRSGFGRLITFVYQWGCDPSVNAPKLVAADDAKEATWINLDMLKHIKDQFHDDHYQIINERRRLV